MFVTNAFHTPFSFLSCLLAFCALSYFQAVGYCKISIDLESENLIGLQIWYLLALKLRTSYLAYVCLGFFIYKMEIITVLRSNAQKNDIE